MPVLWPAVPVLSAWANISINAKIHLEITRGGSLLKPHSIDILLLGELRSVQSFPGIFMDEVFASYALSKLITSLTTGLELLFGFLNRLHGLVVQFLQQGGNVSRGALNDGIEGITHVAADSGPGGPGGFGLAVIEEG